jgi:hypothetical protein
MARRKEPIDIFLWILTALFVILLNITVAFNRPSQEELACASNASRTSALLLASPQVANHKYRCYTR